MDWNTYFALRRTRRQYENVFMVPCGVLGLSGAGVYFLLQPFDPTPIYGFDQILVYGIGTLAAGLLGVAVGPVMGNMLFRATHLKARPLVDQVSYWDKVVPIMIALKIPIKNGKKCVWAWCWRVLVPSLPTTLSTTLLPTSINFSQMDKEFHKHIVKYRVDPSRQSGRNHVPDYYGEKIKSIGDYRKWLRKQRRFQRKADGLK
jgi:import inner membrane translocase subunit TIM23